MQRPAKRRRNDESLEDATTAPDRLGRNGFLQVSATPVGRNEAFLQVPATPVRQQVSATPVRLWRNEAFL
ncbi:hypothetical protein ACOMHN_018440 [Nucella lapillus]